MQLCCFSFNNKRNHPLSWLAAHHIPTLAFSEVALAGDSLLSGYAVYIAVSISTFLCGSAALYVFNVFKDLPQRHLGTRSLPPLG